MGSHTSCVFSSSSSVIHPFFFQSCGNRRGKFDDRDSSFHNINTEMENVQAALEIYKMASTECETEVW